VKWLALALLVACGGASARVRSQLNQVDQRLEMARDSVARAQMGVTKAKPKEVEAARRDLLAAVAEKAFLQAERVYLVAQLDRIDNPSPENKALEDRARAERDRLEVEWKAKLKDVSAPW
jgi:hypothetical protein